MPTVAESMIERVALAKRRVGLASLVSGNGTTFEVMLDEASVWSGSDYAEACIVRDRYEARAAIAAMREPSESMMEAGENGEWNDRLEDHELGICARNVWRAMIDAALKD